MDKVILRLKIIKTKEIYEVVFDTRLSFNENFILLRSLIDLEENIRVYDKTNKFFLGDNVALSVFNLPNFYEFSIY